MRMTVPYKVRQLCPRLLCPGKIPNGESCASIYKIMAFAKIQTKNDKMSTSSFLLPGETKISLCILHPVDIKWISFTFGKLYGFYLYSVATISKWSTQINLYIIAIQTYINFRRTVPKKSMSHLFAMIHNMQLAISQKISSCV